MDIRMTPQQAADAKAHWDAVRAGLHVSQSHDFRDNSCAEVIKRKRELARLGFEVACRLLEEAAKMEATQ